MLGLTYKPGTSTLRRSAAIEIANVLLDSGAKVVGHDPKAEKPEVAAVSRVAVVDDPYDAARGVDALVLMTPWPDYRAIDFARLRGLMRRPFLLDTAGLWSHDKAEAAGMTHWDIGRGRAPRKG
jgi:UDPglucose 6-dehydrogenase